MRQPTRSPTRSIPSPAWCGDTWGWGRTFRHSCSVGDILCQVRGQGATGPGGVEPRKGFWGGGARWPPEVRGVSGCGRECGGDGEEGPWRARPGGLVRPPSSGRCPTSEQENSVPFLELSPLFNYSVTEQGSVRGPLDGTRASESPTPSCPGHAAPDVCVQATGSGGSVGGVPAEGTPHLPHYPGGSPAEAPLSSTVNGRQGEVGIHGGHQGPQDGLGGVTPAPPAPFIACFLGCMTGLGTREGGGAPPPPGALFQAWGSTRPQGSPDLVHFPVCPSGDPCCTYQACSKAESPTRTRRPLRPGTRPSWEAAGVCRREALASSA